MQHRKGAVADIATEKIEKEIQHLAETVKAVQKSPCAEEKKAETVQNLKTSQVLRRVMTKTLMQLSPVNCADSAPFSLQGVISLKR